MSLTSADLQYLAKLHRPLSGTIWHVSAIGGSDSNDGLSFLTPFATLAHAISAVTGSGTQDGIIAAGVFDLVTTHLIAPANLALFEGVGIEGTVIKSQIDNGSVLRICSGLTVRNMTIWANRTPGGGVFQYPVSDDFFTFINVVLDRVRLIGDTDDIYLPGGSTLRAIRPILSSNWDQAYVANGGLLEIFEPIGETIAQNSAAPTSNSSYQAVDGAVIRIIRGALSNVAGNSQPSRSTQMLHARTVTVQGARIELHGGSAYLNVDGTTQIALMADAGCSIIDGGAAFDRTKTSGTVTVLPLYSNGPATGPGPFAMTIHVQDGNGIAIAGARVTVNGVGNTGSTNTDGSGNASFSLAAGTITIAASATGYAALVPVTDTINGSGQWTSDASATRLVVLTALTFAAAGPGQTIVYLTTRDATGAAESGVIVEFQLKSPPANSAGDAFDQTVRQVTSDANGLVQIALPIGCAFNYRTLKGGWTCDVVPPAGPYALKDVVGYFS